MLFHRALFATDFSETSARALEYVFQLHQAGCEEVVLVHVLDEEEISSVMAEPSGFEREVAQRMARNTEKNLDNLIASLENTGLRVRTHLLEGVPDREIVRIAEAERVDVIVLGSHGKSNAIQRLLGTVSEGVIRTARQPVLVIRRDEPEDTG